MARTRANPTTSTEKIETVEVDKTENQAAETVDTKADETETTDTETSEKSVNSKIDKIKDDDDVKIMSESRKGKKITSITKNIIVFDDKGVATCKGVEAKYLLKSGLGFKLAK